MENKLNLPPFYIGQKVVYITGFSMPKNSIHTVSDLAQDPCGCWIVYINGCKKELYVEPDKSYTHIKCDVCKAEVEVGATMYGGGWDVNSFRPVQSYPLMTFQKIVEKEKEEILINN